MRTLPAFRTLIPVAVMAAAALAVSHASAETVDTINKTFEVRAGGTVKLDVDAGSIDVKTGPADAVTVQVIRKFRGSSEQAEKDMLAKHEVTIEQIGNDISIRGRGEKSVQSWWSWFRRGSQRDIRYSITVPQAYNANLKTAGGPIAVRGLQGNVETRTSGGPLHFADIRGSITGGTSGGPIDLERCAGEADLNTSGGGIDVEDCEGTYTVSSSGGGISIEGHRGRITAHTSGGGVRVAQIDGSVDASTSGGPISASFAGQPAGDCRLHTSGGGVSLDIPANARFVLDAHTSGGGVSCDLPGGSGVEKSRGKLRATYNGGGPRIELSSSGGGIHIEATASVEG